MFSQIDQLLLEISKLVPTDTERWLDTPNPALYNPDTKTVVTPRQLLLQGCFQPLWLWVIRQRG